MERIEGSTTLQADRRRRRGYTPSPWTTFSCTSAVARARPSPSRRGASAGSSRLRGSTTRTSSRRPSTSAGSRACGASAGPPGSSWSWRPAVSADEAAGWEAWARLQREAAPAERCAACMRLRLGAAAAAAARLGVKRFSTSLSVSPYQRHDLIEAAGERAAAEHGVDFVYLDLRRRLPRELRREPPARPVPAAVLRLRGEQVGGVARAAGAPAGAGACGAGTGGRPRTPRGRGGAG